MHKLPIEDYLDELDTGYDELETFPEDVQEMINDICSDPEMEKILNESNDLRINFKIDLDFS